MSLWRPAWWQSSFDLLEASISAKRFQMERKIVLLGVFFSSKCWCEAFKESCSPCVPSCQVSVGGWGHVNRSRSAHGPWFWCCSSAELGCDRGTASQNQDMQRCCLQQDWVCFVWDSCPEGNEAVWDNQERSRYKSTYLQHLQSGFFLSSPQIAPVEPFISPLRWSGRGAATALMLKASARAFGGCCSCRYEGPGPRLIPGECGTA